MSPDTLPATPRPQRHRTRRVLKGTLFAILLLLVAMLSMIAGFYVAVARTLPSLPLSADIAKQQTTRIYDDSEEPVLLAELHGLENREVLSSEEMPQVIRDAVVALEDERFYEHSGVDFLAILRALWANLTHGEIVQGGSTITQQLIKNAFLTPDQTVDRKLREAALAYQLEKQWSKQKILDEYLNIVYFGEGAYGIEAAARTYFAVGAAELSLDQAALLAGLPQAPSAYSPRRNPEAALARRDVCLNKMYQQEYITSEELQEALSAPLSLADAKADDEIEVPYWVEMIREQLVSKYGSSRVLGGGLRVYTSIDLRLQKAAEESIAAILDQPGDPSAALVCVDVRTGRLVAMVGGSDFSELQFNLATQGRRQPGSAFKPFVLVTALTQGMSPDMTYDSGPASIDLPSGPWEVNSTDKGPLTLAEATAESSNGVFARLIMDLGPEKVAEMAYQMGIVTSLGEHPNPAIALGGLQKGVSPLEMAMAYATLATGGERLAAQPLFDPADVGYPVTIVRVTDAEGRVLDEGAITTTRVLDEEVAAITTSCLERVIKSGTGTAADIGRPAAGKTGTTTNYCDAWFVGYTPELVTAVWVGYPAENKPMTDVHGIKVTGGSFPAQIWASFMKKALAGVPVSEFKQPAAGEWVSLEVCAESKLLPGEYCPATANMRFRVGTQPNASCAVHAATEVAVPDVVGLSLNEAEEVLSEVHFLVEQTPDSTSPQPAGTVVRQDPEGGSLLLQGKAVRLWVSTGEALVAVPDLVGLDITTARTLLASQGLLSNESIVADEAAAGTVLLQYPDAGTLVSPGDAVDIVISGGAEPPEPEPEPEPD